MPNLETAEHIRTSTFQSGSFLLKEKVMKFKNENIKETTKEVLNWEGKSTAGTFNAFTLSGISLLWGHMLNLISPWFVPLTIILLMMGYSQEVKQPKLEKSVHL